MPTVVKNLLIINGLVFVAQLSLNSTMIEWFALWPLTNGMTQEWWFYPWQLITSGFLHGDFAHILFNMFGLWMFGMRIENVLGTKRFIQFYFICLLGASLVQLLIVSLPFYAGLGQPALYPTLGASGAVLGVLAAFGLLFPDEKIYLYFAIPVSAKWVVLGYAAIDLFSGVSGASTGIANWAHLGGMATGALLILYWSGKLPVKPVQYRSI